MTVRETDMDNNELEWLQECGQYLAEKYRQAGLGGGAQMDHIVMAMQDLLALEADRDWVVGVTKAEASRFLTEAGRNWLEEHGPEQRRAYRHLVLNMDLLQMGSQELDRRDVKAASRVLGRLLECYSLDGLGEGISLTHITLAEYGLLALGVRLEAAVFLAMERVELRLQTLASRWEESHPLHLRKPLRSRARRRLQWALDREQVRMHGGEPEL